MDEYDFVIEAPDVIRPDADQGAEDYYVIRAHDTYPDTPRFDVSKQFTDLNGGDLEPGDLVKVDVSLIPVGGSVGPIAYWEQLN
ncbi:MAG: hypothetical protein H6765_04080 [Candidatus Peribacteria bacterium]|nr:MAG: hypothetical protein H6765_04080 [Candidatus Peribacteria bacterium]